MQGIVSLLDDPYAQIVHDIWDELKTKCGIAGTQVPQFPHFSYHVAGRYDETLRPLLKRSPPDKKRSKLTQRAWEFSTAATPWYLFHWCAIQRSHSFTNRSIPFSLLPQPPHSPITSRARGRRTSRWRKATSRRKICPDVIRVLNDRNFEWEISINNLTWLSDTNVITRYDF